MDRQSDIREILRQLDEKCPGGYALALHIKFTTPRFLFQTYAAAWLDVYTQRGYVMTDPTVHWGFENSGTIRWSDLAHMDAAGVLSEAAGFGLVYGVCCATETEGSRSVASFARADREFTDEEMADLFEDVAHLHDMTSGWGSLSPQTAEELHSMSVRFTHPGSVAAERR